MISSDVIRVWALLPVKPFKQAKTRLADTLTPEARESLAIQFFQHTLKILTSIKRFAGVLVVSRDPAVLKLARECGAQTLMESGQPELNEALRRGCEMIRELGGRAVFIIPADLPFLTAEDVESILKLGRTSQTVVIVPDRNKDGTNGMLLNPPNIIPLSYGIGSFGRHKAAAEAQPEVTLHIHEVQNMALDVDTPADFHMYQTARVFTESG
jgi:2-phospho-L-lactate guanylyltransferase